MAQAIHHCFCCTYIKTAAKLSIFFVVQHMTHRSESEAELFEYLCQQLNLVVKEKEKEGKVYRAFQQYVSRLPTGQGFNSCVDDLLSCIRYIKTTHTSSEQRILEVIRYLEAPPFTKHLAAFGNLPGHPYVLVFNWCAHQYEEPPSNLPTITKREEPSSNTKREETPVAAGKREETHVAGGIGQEDELTRIFNEPLKSKERCRECKAIGSVVYNEEQRRSSDEGSSYFFRCTLCKFFWFIR